MRQCPDCGANLDPQEICDCHDEEQKETAPGAANTEGGETASKAT